MFFICVDFIDQNTGVIVGQSGRMLRTTNAGINWDATIFGSNTFYLVGFQ